MLFITNYSEKKIKTYLLSIQEGENPPWKQPKVTPSFSNYSTKDTSGTFFQGHMHIADMTSLQAFKHKYTVTLSGMNHLPDVTIQLQWNGLGGFFVIIRKTDSSV